MERVTRIELVSRPWQGRIIATIRYARRSIKKRRELYFLISFFQVIFYREDELSTPFFQVELNLQRFLQKEQELLVLHYFPLFFDK